ncbi:hypothetical protein BDV95DRAFT_593289 [Massariosphaeria phaeospora]|uniref:Uncharacterized protein n=1 Tax=Massariosphaeria phaeospora TaxID=100035 RepID=A0A7C8IH99_9PLEO|nr:hypothetical protein BDV95DRAFT_593289 [Massariosphaeria phaeospora]
MPPKSPTRSYPLDTPVTHPHQELSEHSPQNRVMKPTPGVGPSTPEPGSGEDMQQANRADDPAQLSEPNHGTAALLEYQSSHPGSHDPGLDDVANPSTLEEGVTEQPPPVSSAYHGTEAPAEPSTETAQQPAEAPAETSIGSDGQPAKAPTKATTSTKSSKRRAKATTSIKSGKQPAKAPADGSDEPDEQPATAPAEASTKPAKNPARRVHRRKQPTGSGKGASKTSARTAPGSSKAIKEEVASEVQGALVAQAVATAPRTYMADMMPKLDADIATRPFPEDRDPLTELYFSNGAEAAYMFSRLAWRCPAYDLSIPHDELDRQELVRRLVDAFYDVTEFKDKSSKSISTRWVDSVTGEPKGFYDCRAVEKVCWDVAYLSERLHRQGPGIFYIHDPEICEKFRQTRDYTFHMRLEAIFELLKLFKHRCDKLMEGSFTQICVAIPKDVLAEDMMSLSEAATADDEQIAGLVKHEEMDVDQPNSLSEMTAIVPRKRKTSSEPATAHSDNPTQQNKRAKEEPADTPSPKE